MQNKSNLDGIYEFMKHSYFGNWQNRWGQTPFMTNFSQENKNESILGHMWACMEFWFQIKSVCPALAKVINSEKLYEILINHDLGETYVGDVSMTRQVNGEGKNKKLTERDQVKILIKTLNKKIQQIILANFDGFEKDINQISDVEFLMAKFIDTLQGDQFALSFGNNLSENSGLINKIINVRFIPYTKRLISVLEKSKYFEASIEIKNISNHHLDLIRLQEIKISAKNF